jgi:hypothetical protein
MVSFVARPAINGFVPRHLISLPIVEAPNGHEQKSEVGKRLTNAECRLVGPGRKPRDRVRSLDFLDSARRPLSLSVAGSGARRTKRFIAQSSISAQIGQPAWRYAESQNIHS